MHAMQVVYMRVEGGNVLLCPPPSQVKLDNLALMFRALTEENQLPSINSCSCMFFTGKVCIFHFIGMADALWNCSL